MAALGWLLNLGFAGGVALVSDSRVTTIAVGDRTFTPAERVECIVPSSDRTFTPADD